MRRVFVGRTPAKSRIRSFIAWKFSVTFLRPWPLRSHCLRAMHCGHRMLCSGICVGVNSLQCFPKDHGQHNISTLPLPSQPEEFFCGSSWSFDTVLTPAGICCVLLTFPMHGQEYQWLHYVASTYSCTTNRWQKSAFFSFLCIWMTGGQSGRGVGWGGGDGQYEVKRWKIPNLNQFHEALICSMTFYHSVNPSVVYY